MEKLRNKDSFHGWLLLSLIVAFILLGTVTYHFVENLGWLDALFFSVVTATTVGYGDITPHTEFGKIFTIFYIFLSISLVFTFINHFSKRTTKKGLIDRFFSAKDTEKK